MPKKRNGINYFNMAKNGNIHPTRIFKEPKELELVWEEYKASLGVESENWVKVQYVGKDGSRVTDAPMMPLSLEGFEVWYYAKNKKFIGQYFDNPKENFNDFIAICSHIRKEIRANQITGGLLGFFNPSITQRLNNLKDSTEIEVKQEPRVFNIKK